MHFTYQAYSKQIEGKEHFFVKKLRSFPELPGVPDLQEGFGMHTDFSKACHIAGIDDAAIVQNLLAELQAAEPAAKVIDLNAVREASIQTNAG